MLNSTNITNRNVQNFYGWEVIVPETIQQMRCLINENACEVPFSILHMDEDGFGRIVGTDKNANAIEVFHSNPLFSVRMVCDRDDERMTIVYKKSFLTKISKKFDAYAEKVIAKAQAAAENAYEQDLRHA